MFRTFVNGREQSAIAVADRGLQYGDGLFETIAVRAGGVPQLWERHWRRLSLGCDRLGIAGVVQAELRDEVRRVCAGIERGVVKLIITRGEGGRGYRPMQNGTATRIVAAYPPPDYPAAHWQDGVAVRVCAVRWGRNRALAGLKHLNRLEQVLARREWDDPSIAEGLMLDDAGHVVSGTMSNVFLVRSGRLITPALEECGVAGVMRGLIIDTAHELAMPVEETAVSLQDMHQANEIFLSNALIGLWPVRRLEQQAYTIGPVTRLLAQRLGSLQHSDWGAAD